MNMKRKKAEPEEKCLGTVFGYVYCQQTGSYKVDRPKSWQNMVSRVDLINFDYPTHSHHNISCLWKHPGSHFYVPKWSKNQTFFNTSRRGEAIWPIFIHHMHTTKAYLCAKDPPQSSPPGWVRLEKVIFHIKMIGKRVSPQKSMSGIPRGGEWWVQWSCILTEGSIPSKTNHLVRSYVVVWLRTMTWNITRIMGGP